MATIDEISPPYVGEDKLVLTLEDPQLTLLANLPFQVNVDYSATEPEGLQLPLELILQGPKAGQQTRRLFTRSLPSSLLLTPRVRGTHFILLKELFHNRWQGRLTVEVEGEDPETNENERTL